MQDAGVMVRRLIGEVKDRAQKQRLRDVVPEGIGTVERDNKAFGTQPNEFNNQPPLSLEESTMGPGGFPMTAGLTLAPKLYNTADKAVDLIEAGKVGLRDAKNIVKNFFNKRDVYSGATKVGTSTKKDYTKDKDFLKVFNKFKNKYFKGNTMRTNAELGLPERFAKDLELRIFKSEGIDKASRKKNKLLFYEPTVKEPKTGIMFRDLTTSMKSDPKKYLKLKVPKDSPNRFLDQESLGHFLGLKFKRDDKGIRIGVGKDQYDQLGKQLIDLGVRRTNQGLFDVNDAINKIVEKSKTKIVKGQRKSQMGAGRYNLEKKFDPGLFQARNNVKTRITGRSKDLDTYLPNAVDDVGHPYSLTKSEEKFKKLFKDSNINRLNTLVYQDSLINSQLFKNSGYESKYDKMFETLSKLQNKKVTPEIQEKILKVKKDMNDNYNYIQDIISDVSKLDQYINRDKLNADKKFLKYLSETQADRVQKIDVNVPKVGDTFKSEDIFVDMSVINPKYIMGYVNNINPKAKKFKDLSLSEQALYKNNLLQQNSEIVSEYYRKAKFPEEDVEAVRETVGMDFSEGGRASFKEGTPKQPVFKKGAASQLSKLALVNPTSIFGLNYLFGIDPESGIDRAALGAEAALSKELVKSSQDLIKKLPIEKRRAVQRLLNLGMSPRFAIKAARALTPLGLLSLAGEGAYQGGKYMLERRKMLESLTDEQRDELLAREKQEAVSQMRRGDAEAFDYIGAANGGRIGFADGPSDPSKRKFMKIMGGLASLPVLGKFFKIAEPLAPVVSKAAESVPPYFLNLVEKIRALGRSGPGTKDRSESFVYGDYEMEIDYDTGAIDIKRTEQGMFGDEIAPTEEVNMFYRPGRADETTGGKTPPDEYEEFTVRPDGDGKMKDVEDGVPDDVIDEGSISKEELEQLIIRNLANE